MKTPAKKTMVIGAAWYREDQWERLKAACVDRETIEDTYAEWLRIATARTAELRGQGLRIEPVDVDVERLVAWCAVHGRPVDAKARSAYAAELLQQQYSKKNQ